jgi:hypothetical protein
VRAAAAQRAVLRGPGLNQVPLHARQQGLAVVQRQAKRIKSRIGVTATTAGNFAGGDIVIYQTIFDTLAALSDWSQKLVSGTRDRLSGGLRIGI